MSTHGIKAEIDLKADGTGTVKLDGVDVSRAIQRLTIHAGAGQAPQLDLGLMVRENIRFGGEVEITLSDSVRQVLITMGWTPPGETILRRSPR